MVSFSCEACGDVLTKKKLDPHVNRCWNASFTCLDCMQHFNGTAYRSHTSCISEAQKYQGHLYRDKKTKAQSEHIPVPPPAPQPLDMVPLKAYVEDGSDIEMDAVAIVQPPPAAPSPPPAPMSGQHTPVNVFDFMTDQSPTRPSMTKGGASNKTGNATGPLPKTVIPDGSFTYGGGPVELSLQKFESDPHLLKTMLPPTTPNLANQKAARGLAPVYEIREPRTAAERQADGRSSQKRKRQQVEDLDLSRARRQDFDANGTPGLRSGLTGGLSRLLSKSEQPHPTLLPSPVSPAKRTRGRERDSVDREQARSRRNRDPSSEPEDTRARRSRHRHPRSHSPADDHGPARLPSSRQLKAIEYRRSSQEPGESGSGSGSGAGALVLTKSRRHSSQGGRTSVASGTSFARHSHAELFLSLVVKGPDSTKGQSVYTALKGFHGHVDTMSNGNSNSTSNGTSSGSNGLYNGSSVLANMDHAERELLKGLRMKRNKRGEVILFARSAHDDSS